MSPAGALVKGQAMTATKPTLWHYTCSHGHLAMGHKNSVLLPAAQLVVAHDRHRVPEQGHMVWLTDLDRPITDALGLTSNFMACDRTRYRYRVTDDTTCERWVDVARRLPTALRLELQQAPGVLPMHWWVSFLPVPVVFNPVPRPSPLPMGAAK